MCSRSLQRRHRNRRRGAIAVLVAVAMAAIVGFAALTVDVGALYTAKAELQTAADAAALAGASAIFTDSGLGSQGTTFIEEQIRNRISATELQSEFGTSKLTFLDDEGNPTTYFSTGNPGLSGGMANTVGSRIGHLVAFFLHRTVQANGANAIYEISGVRYGRIMALDFTGRLDRRSLVVQPVAYTGDAVVIDDEAPGTDGQIGRVILVK